MPRLAVALLVAKPTPFVEEFLNSVAALDYDKALLDVFLYNNQPYNEQTVREWAERHQHAYRSIRVLNLAGQEERWARAEAL